MKKCMLIILSLFAVVTASAQESGNRIYGNNGYYQQRQRLASKRASRFSTIRLKPVASTQCSRL